jgi:hypothetical protein
MDRAKSSAAAAAKQAREDAADAELTPLGRRTLAGFVKRFGEETGERKFQTAMENGTIDRAKMENKGAADDDADGDTVTGMPPNKRARV